MSLITDVNVEDLEDSFRSEDDKYMLYIADDPYESGGGAIGCFVEGSLSNMTDLILSISMNIDEYYWIPEMTDFIRNNMCKLPLDTYPMSTSLDLDVYTLTIIKFSKSYWVDGYKGRTYINKRSVVQYLPEITSEIIKKYIGF